MATKTPEEKYLEWLDREEEQVGIDTIMRAATDMQEAIKLLEQELGYTPTEKQLAAFQGAGMTRYEALPSIGVYHEREFHPEWQGYQSVYRDIMTGRFVSRLDVESALFMLR